MVTGLAQGQIGRLTCLASKQEQAVRPESGAQRLAWARLDKSRFVGRASAAVVELAKFRAGRLCRTHPGKEVIDLRL